MSDSITIYALVDPEEWAQLDAYVAKHGPDRSHWVRLALQKIGALKGEKR